MLNAYDKFVSVLNVKELVSTFNQEKTQAGAFSVIVKSLGSFVQALLRRLVWRKQIQPN